jgi:coenzyme F420-reducing hydrogenase delta subunit
LRLEWVSAAEGEKFAQVVKQVTAEISEMGPLNWTEVMEANYA